MTIILFRIVGICLPRFKWNCLSNQIFFLILFFNFWNLHQILNILKKKMIVIPTLFRKLQNVKNLVAPLSKKHRSRTPFDSQRVKGSQTLAKSAWEHFHHNFLSVVETLVLKISTLVICQMLGVFRNTLTAYDKYPVQDCVNFSSLIQLELSLKPTIFSNFVVPFLESTWNF